MDFPLLRIAVRRVFDRQGRWKFMKKERLRARVWCCDG
jgi:hypothetical protein